MEARRKGQESLIWETIKPRRSIAKHIECVCFLQTCRGCLSLQSQASLGALPRLDFSCFIESSVYQFKIGIMQYQGL